MCDIIAVEQIALKNKITVGRIDFIDKKMLDRINELAKKKKEQGLTEAEQKEQKELYKIYLGEIRTQFNATLDNVSVEEKDGTVKPFKEAYKKPYDKN